MEVFIGWSGERSRSLAVAMRSWLPLVLHFVEPWLSEEDVSAGVRWNEAIAKQLDTCNFGILCVTPENADSPWITFEAGSLAKSLEDSRVIPLLLGLEFSQITGPLAQFQAKKVDSQGIREVVQSINKASGDPIPTERADQLVELAWPQLESIVEAIPAAAGAAKPARSQQQILEELVAGVRSLEARVREMDELASESGRAYPRRLRDPRFAEMYLMELSRCLEMGPEDPVRFLIVGGLLRDQYPFIYELAVEVYRVAESGDVDAAERATSRFLRALEVVGHMPPIGPEDEWGPHISRMAMDLLLEGRQVLRKARRTSRKAAEGGGKGS
jgi:hypothetical protein